MEIEKRIQNLENVFLQMLDEQEILHSAVHEGFKKIDDNFKKMEKRFERLELSAASLETKVSPIYKNVNELKGDTSAGFDSVGNQINELKTEIGKIGDVTGYEEIHRNLKVVR